MKTQAQEEAVSSRKRSLLKMNVIRAKFSDITLDYQFESKPVGTGGFGSVYRAIHRQTDQVRAIKHIQLKQNLAESETSGNFIAFPSGSGFLGLEASTFSEVPWK